MNKSSRRLCAIAIALFAPTIVHAGSTSHRALNEDVALDLLQSAIKRDHVYEKRISLDCVSFGTEEKTNAFFEFALRENHSPKCGGDPDTAPVVDRYRVYRASGKIEVYDVTADHWKPYKRGH